MNNQVQIHFSAWLCYCHLRKHFWCFCLFSKPFCDHLPRPVLVPWKWLVLHILCLISHKKFFYQYCWTKQNNSVLSSMWQHLKIFEENFSCTIFFISMTHLGLIWLTFLHVFKDRLKITYVKIIQISNIDCVNHYFYQVVFLCMPWIIYYNLL